MWVGDNHPASRQAHPATSISVARTHARTDGHTHGRTHAHTDRHMHVPRRPRTHARSHRCRAGSAGTGLGSARLVDDPHGLMPRIDDGRDPMPPPPYELPPCMHRSCVCGRCSCAMWACGCIDRRLGWRGRPRSTRGLPCKIGGLGGWR